MLQEKLKNICLLVTSTVTPMANFTLLDNIDKRLKQYEESLRFWIDHSPFVNIIICDNSSYPYAAFFVERAKNKGKKLEILSFSGNADAIATFGKGYGEGGILEYVARHSILFQSCQGFFKITGRLQVPNIQRILRRFNPRTNYFMPALLKPRLFCNDVELLMKRRIDTRFYYCRKDDFLSHFMDAYCQVNDPQGYYLENVYYDVLRQVRFTYFLPIPIIKGYSGSTAEPYVNIVGMKRMGYTFFIWIKQHISNLL
ncbi:hypothetical protein GCM10023231_11570 [Olivibacter ginsenosidimutans]|uniref:Glycosyltransferase family 2 protein n=1 Tax=Olivibacter ginsenosidimutans TaxID=1176537 RepID=A0ABP9AUS8_9SPHI